MDNLYHEHIIDHYKHPRYFGKLDRSNISASDNLVSCGDSLEMELLISKNGKKVIKIAWQGRGCAISMATASMLSERIVKSEVSKLKDLNKDDILDLLGIKLSPTRLKCALLSLEVLHKALNKGGLWRNIK